MSITMSPEYLGCPEGDCDSGEFWLLPDGRIMCADGECYAVFGYWTRPEPFALGDDDARAEGFPA